MPSHTVQFEVADPASMDLPFQLLADGGKYTIEVADAGVTVWGNSKGLLYLAEVLTRCAIGGYAETFHVHLPLDTTAGPGGPAEDKPEFTVFAADASFA